MIYMSPKKDSVRKNCHCFVVNVLVPKKSLLCFLGSQSSPGRKKSETNLMGSTVAERNCCVFLCVLFLCSVIFWKGWAAPTGDR